MYLMDERALGSMDERALGSLPKSLSVSMPAPGSKARQRLMNSLFLSSLREMCANNGMKFPKNEEN